MSFDLARIRGLYPTLGAATAYLDGPFGALQPESVIRAIIATLRSSPAQPGSRSVRSQRTAVSVENARDAVADLVGTTADSVVLGASQTSLLMRFARLLSRDWQLGDEVVLSRLDADSTLLPWLRAARSSGGVVRWAEVDLDTGELPAWQYEHLVSGHTRVITVPLGNPATGTVPDIRAISDLAHRNGALVVVDAGVAIPHLPLDLDELGADLLSLSAATFGGPTVAAIAARPGLLRGIESDVRGPVPQRFEDGPLPIELLDGLTAAIDHLADFADGNLGSDGTRRERIVHGVSVAGEHTRSLFERLDSGLRSVRGVTVLGSSGDRLPVAAFTITGFSPDHVGDFLQRAGVSVWTGPTGMTELLTAYGADELGGAICVGVMPYSAPHEVDHMLEALGELVP
ncbi:MAG TPA: aminotransferase class V-fold PLP-dependent enzyme [Jatrophihabitantaceae bacterium]|nr:aminotransferase class V-fold PLP-dependent enzyme [Jatrophihabitantaceae bacterium]